MHQQIIRLDPLRRGLTDITGAVDRVVRASGVEAGLCHVFLHHTSASLVVQENADPAVQRDLEAWMRRLVRDGDPLFTHTAEGPDDMSAHVRSVLTATSLTLPVRAGRLDLGTWQAVYLWEHRERAGGRRLTVSVWGG